MAEATKESFVGKIKSSEFSKKSDQGWKKYSVTFDGESDSRKMDIPPDTDYEPRVGDEITVWKGKFNSWTLDKGKLPGAPSTNGESKPSTNGAHTSVSSYRDPKVIEFQFYFQYVTNLYAACMPFLAEKPETIDEIDEVVDQINAKAKALMLESK